MVTRRISAIALMSTLSAFAACRTPTGSDTLAVDSGFTAVTDLSVDGIPDEDTFKSVSKEAGGLIKGGRIVKFFVDNRQPHEPHVYFVNANFKLSGQTPEFAKFHYDFAKKKLNIPEAPTEFNTNTYFADDKRYMAGSLQSYNLDDRVVYGIQFYPQDVIHDAKAFKATQLIASKVGIPGAKFAFVEAGSQQETTEAADLFAVAGYERLSIEKILGQVKYIAMNQGEAWGYLRIFPRNQDDLSAKDIVVFDGLPLDLTVVAATITRAYQDSNSHVNLKSKERKTPNAILRDAALDHPDLAPWANQPVHIVVGPEKLLIEATTAAVIDAKLAERMSKPWLTLATEPSQTLLAYDAMCVGINPADCFKQGKKFGTKASNLGFLQHPKVLGRLATPGTMSAKLGYDLVPFGFGIPLSFYNNMVDYAPNAALRAKIAALVQQEKAGTLSSAARLEMVKAVQTLFFAAKFPPGDLVKIKAKLAETLPGVEKIKVRSSANAEDIDGFDGAGLHDSYSAKASAVDSSDQVCTRDVSTDEGGEGDVKMNPRTLACAIKGVYASLWNKRAIEERSFARIDHASVTMGISVLPAYDYQYKIAANSVVVTRVINTSDVFGYSISVQKKNNLVTNPDAGTYSELTIAAIGFGTEPTSLTVTRFAKPKADEPVLTEAVLAKEDMLKMVALTKKIEEAYCLAKPGYYPHQCKYVSVDVEKPKSLDFEMKVLDADGAKRFVIKQVREFGGQ